MKTVILAAALALSGCAHVDRQDVAWMAIHLADTHQTLGIADRGCSEKNAFSRFVMGTTYPDRNDVYRWSATMAALHFAVHKTLEHYGLDSTWLKYVQIGASAANVEANAHRDSWRPKGSFCTRRK